MTALLRPTLGPLPRSAAIARIVGREPPESSRREFPTSAQLRGALQASPLGRILAPELEPHAVPLVPAPLFYTTPGREAGTARQRGPSTMLSRAG